MCIYILYLGIKLDMEEGVLYLLWIKLFSNYRRYIFFEVDWYI